MIVVVLICHQQDKVPLKRNFKGCDSSVQKDFTLIFILLFPCITVCILERNVFLFLVSNSSQLTCLFFSHVCFLLHANSQKSLISHFFIFMT